MTRQKNVAPNAMNAPAATADAKHLPNGIAAFAQPTSSAFASRFSRRKRIGFERAQLLGRHSP